MQRRSWRARDGGEADIVICKSETMSEGALRLSTEHLALSGLTRQKQRSSVDVISSVIGRAMGITGTTGIIGEDEVSGNSID